MIGNDIAYDEDAYTAWEEHAQDIASRPPYTDIYSGAVQVSFEMEV